MKTTHKVRIGYKGLALDQKDSVPASISMFTENHATMNKAKNKDIPAIGRRQILSLAQDVYCIINADRRETVKLKTIPN